MADFLFSPVSHDEAVDFIVSKPVVSRAVFNRLLPELRARAFTITGVDAADAVQAIRDRIADLPAGATWDAVKKDIARQIGVHCVDPAADAEERDKQVNASNRRAELLLRTHGFQAYQTASFDRMSEQKDVLPYWQYVTMGDGRVRPSHAALNGMVLPASSPFWHTHFPPWDFGCRCQAVPLSKEDHDDIKEADAEKAPDQQRVIEGPALKELELNNRLFRGPNQIANVSPPSGPNAYHWHPGDRDLSVADLRSRYDADVFNDFEKWARKTEVEKGKTVWDWIGGKPAEPPAHLAEGEPRAVSGGHPEPSPDTRLAIRALRAQTGNVVVGEDRALAWTRGAQAPSRVSVIEDRIAAEPLEHAVIFRPNGVVRLEVTGAPERVSVPPVVASGRPLSHNHPGGNSFSPRDVRAACELRLTELRVVTADHAFSLSGELTPGNFPAIRAAADLADAQVRAVQAEMIVAGEITEADAAKQHFHLLWAMVARQSNLNLHYARKLRTDTAAASPADLDDAEGRGA